MDTTEFVELEIFGGKVLLDVEDYIRVNQMSWHVTRRGYAYHSSNTLGNLAMHTYIMGRLWIDHKNGNKLDNRRSNLRPCTPSQNQANKPGRTGCTSDYKGVSLHGASGKWTAQLTHRGKKVYAGLFKTELEAAPITKKQVNSSVSSHI